MIMYDAVNVRWLSYDTQNRYWQNMVFYWDYDDRILQQRVSVFMAQDAMEVTLEQRDASAFRKFDYWQQWDAMCAHAARPDTSALKLMLYFVGMGLAAMNVAVVYVLTEFVFPGPSFTETFVKNLIAWTSLAYQLGFDLAYWPLATNWGPLNKWKLGTLKITGLGHVAARRTILDFCSTILFTASRLFMIASPQPSALCGGQSCAPESIPHSRLRTPL